MPYMHAILGDLTLSLRVEDSSLIIHGPSQGGSKNQLSVGAHNSGPGFFMPQMWWDQITRFTKNVGALDTSYFLWGEKTSVSVGLYNQVGAHNLPVIYL